MTLKEARQRCRERAIEEHVHWWSLGWNKQNGYFPEEKKTQYHICYVRRDGTYCYASKANEKKHNLKGNIPGFDPKTGRRV